MSKNMSMEHITDIIANTREGAQLFLSNAALCDNDFNGENGPEYLWVDAEGFGNNFDYCWSIAEKENKPRLIIERFVSLWMGKDSYYVDYSLDILQHEEILFVSLVFVTEC
jgi:hypothetical protein